MELRSTKNKIHAIQEWPTLKNVGEVADVPVLEGLGVEEKGSVAVAVEETEREEEAAEGKAFGGEVGRRLLRLNMRGNDIFRAAVGTMTVEKVAYNLVNLKDQNSFNIDHNASPTFSLKNNQSNLFEGPHEFVVAAASLRPDCPTRVLLVKQDIVRFGPTPSRICPYRSEPTVGPNFPKRVFQVGMLTITSLARYCPLWPTGPHGFVVAATSLRPDCPTRVLLVKVSMHL
ncbi:hypothetical protein NC653_007841 [Populus alba x Populus x berolinensis]|uniref:Uncharacterized protein n=1 Tax=Populus alba x Populus x berolinensis TaxID=444605 RepID=A0AAD6W7U2_9ROSI|nr:hypothetical protein NC653_007841 [Populus alba x Populus x berolinensis]